MDKSNGTANSRHIGVEVHCILHVLHQWINEVVISTMADWKFL